MTVATYTATTPNDSDETFWYRWRQYCTWSLSGSDASDFNIGNQDGGTPGTLTFKEIPQLRDARRNQDNLYRVTVEVSDGNTQGHPAHRPSWSPTWKRDGKVTLSSVQPKVAIDLTASLKDSDGDGRRTD